MLFKLRDFSYPFMKKGTDISWIQTENRHRQTIPHRIIKCAIFELKKEFAYKEFNIETIFNCKKPWSSLLVLIPKRVKQLPQITAAILQKLFFPKLYFVLM